MLYLSAPPILALVEDLAELFRRDPAGFRVDGIERFAVEGDDLSHEGSIGSRYPRTVSPAPRGYHNVRGFLGVAAPFAAAVPSQLARTTAALSDHRAFR